MSSLSVIFKILKAGIMKYINKLLAIYKKEDPSEVKAEFPKTNGIVLKKAKRICRSVLIGFISGLVLGILSHNITGCLCIALVLAVVIGISMNQISDDEEIEKEIAEQIRPMQQELEILVTKSQNYDNSEEMKEMRERIGEAYFNTSAVEQLIRYFETYRADTYKEAVNLYEAAKEKEQSSAGSKSEADGDEALYRRSRGVSVNTIVRIPEEYQPISMWGYFGYEILFSIPLIGIILLLVFAFGGTRNINLQNYARGHFCGLILLIGFLAMFMPGVFGFIFGRIF